MSLIKLEGVASTSAVSKAQKDAAVYMFGSKGHSIVAVLDKFARAKEIQAPHLAGILALMKDGEDDEIIKFTSSAAGKKSIVAAKQFAIAKTFTNAIKYLKLIRVPMKWIPGHSDTAAARIQQTETIRASKRASTKPEKPIKLDNPHAPEAVEQEQTKASAAVNKVWLAKNFSATNSSTWTKLQDTFNEEYKDLGFSTKFVKSEGALRVSINQSGYQQIRNMHIGLDTKGKRPGWHLYAVAPTDKSGAGIEGRFIGPRLTAASIIAAIRDFLANGDKTKEALTSRIAGATVFDKDVSPASTVFDEYDANERKAKRDPEAPLTLAKLTKDNISKASHGMRSGLAKQVSDLLKNTGVYGASFMGDSEGAYGLNGYMLEMHLSGTHTAADLASIAIIPPQTGTDLKGNSWRAVGIKIGRESTGKVHVIGPKLTATGFKAALAKILKEKMFSGTTAKK